MQFRADHRSGGRNWPRLYHGGRSWPWAVLQRLAEAYLILAGSHSLHRAWQAGKDEGNREEYTRLIVNGAWQGELRARANSATTGARVNRNPNVPSAAMSRLIGLVGYDGVAIGSQADVTKMASLLYEVPESAPEVMVKDIDDLGEDECRRRYVRNAATAKEVYFPRILPHQKRSATP